MMIMTTTNFYCMKGKHKVNAEGEIVEMANGRVALTGICPEHGTKMFKFVKAKVTFGSKQEGEFSRATKRIEVE
jgi:hypothetical protein